MKAQFEEEGRLHKLKMAEKRERQRRAEELIAQDKALQEATRLNDEKEENNHQHKETGVLEKDSPGGEDIIDSTKIITPLSIQAKSTDISQIHDSLEDSPVTQTKTPERRTML